MSDDNNIQAVQAVFAAFARGDLNAALAMMSDDIDWHNFGPPSLGYTTPRRGRVQVEQFFRQVDDLFDHEKFDAHEFVAQADKVVVTGTEIVRSKRTGKSMTNQWCMVFNFKDAKIIRWRCYEDTAGVMGIMR